MPVYEVLFAGSKILTTRTPKLALLFAAAMPDRSAVRLLYQVSASPMLASNVPADVQVVPSVVYCNWRNRLDVLECRRSNRTTMFDALAVLTLNCTPAVPLAAVAAGYVEVFHATLPATASVDPAFVSPPACVALVPPIRDAVPLPVDGAGDVRSNPVGKFHWVMIWAFADPAQPTAISTAFNTRNFIVPLLGFGSGAGQEPDSTPAGVGWVGQPAGR